MGKDRKVAFAAEEGKEASYSIECVGQQFPPLAKTSTVGKWAVVAAVGIGFQPGSNKGRVKSSTSRSHPSEEVGFGKMAF